MKVVSSIVRELLSGLNEIGIRPEKILPQANSSAGLLNDPDYYFPASVLDGIWQQAVTESNDPLISLRVAPRTSLFSLGVLGYIIRNCATAGQAFEKLLKYNRLTNDILQFDYQLDQHQVRMCFWFSADSLSEVTRWQIIVQELLLIQQSLVELTRQPVRPLSVHTSLPRHLKERLTAAFASPVETDAPLNGISYPLEVMQLPIVSANAGLLRHIETFADTRLARPVGAGEFTCRVEQYILREHTGTLPSLPEVAGALNLSARTLQRRLRQEQTSYQQVLEGLRETLAKQYLKENLTVNEIAYLLGYSVPGAFSRSFRKWTGKSPLEYRKSCGS
jgi:AraC-like DNA-binding protein